MTYVRFAPEHTFMEPLLGWRCWRVQRIQTLSGATRYRLCAAGDYGRPKVWQPRVANIAACSDRRSMHDAPHPRHECGIYAYREREDAERKLVWFEAYAHAYHMQKYKHDARPPYETWAIGRVSLWGRVVECELGWRTQFAYPYDVEVFTTSGKAAVAIRDDYAIDATGRPKKQFGLLLQEHAETTTEARNAQNYDDWYEKTIFGTMDRSFLRPYHEEVMGRLDGLERSIKRLVGSQRVAAVADDGLDEKGGG